MTLNETMVLWLLMLAVVVSLLVPVSWKWGKLSIWACLALLTSVLVLIHALVLRN
jgi:hypothetical protein